ncbi:transposase [Agrobacterium tumefaciens]|uniref:transposase n=1 Tax=Agrobacterium tumefaciens TaxID=358 RepID=UPI001F31C23B
MWCPLKRGGHQGIDEGQKLAVRLVGRNGRRRFDLGSKDRLVAACLERGASVLRLAREHGVNANLVWDGSGSTPRCIHYRRLRHLRLSPLGSSISSWWIRKRFTRLARATTACSGV